MATVRKRNPLVPIDHPNAYYFVTTPDPDDSDGSAGLPGEPDPESEDIPVGGDGSESPDEEDSDDTESFYKMAAAMFPSMPPGFIEAFAEAWVEFADAPNAVDLALASLRQDDRYALWFPGNLRDDGTVHIGEAQYWDQRALYEQAVNAVGLDPGIFTDDQYVALLSGDVSTTEFAARIRTQSNSILSRSEEFKQYYAEIYGFEPTDTAILESAFTGTNDALLRQAGIASVGFEGERREFDLPLVMASAIYDAGVTTQGQASELFGQAATDVPLFGVLAQRHFDPDDEFDLGNFLASAVFDDQEEMRRMQRLLAQERALFSRSSSFRSRGNAMVGLTEE